MARIRFILFIVLVVVLTEVCPATVRRVKTRKLVKSQTKNATVPVQPPTAEGGDALANEPAKLVADQGTNQSDGKDVEPAKEAANNTRPVSSSSPFARSSVRQLSPEENELDKLFNDPLLWDDNAFNDLNLLGASNQPVRSPSRPSNLDLLGDYEDLLFDNYDSFDPDEASPPSRTQADSTLNNKYLQSEVCGRKFFCRRGDRGPCQRNEIFTLQTNASAVKRTSCSNILTYPWNGCLPAGKLGVAAASSSAPSGCCSIRFPQRPCFGYPPNYRYSVESNRCYACSSNSWNQWGSRLGFNSGPCSPNKIFVDMDGVNGMCRCRDHNQLLSKIDDRCHRIYAKGPCRRGEWLEPDINGFGVCRRSPCPNSCDGRHIYWRPTPGSKGGCYKSFTRGPCRQGSYFLVEDYATRRGRCVSQYGSSYNPMRNYGTGSSNQMSSNSIWSNFGMYPPSNLFAYGDDYEDFNWDY